MPIPDSALPMPASEAELPPGPKSAALIAAERVAWRLANVDFPWDVNKALEFALLRTYAVPSISGLLERTGEFRQRTLKRYDDTALLIREVLANGLDSDRAARAFARINDMHGRFRIAEADFLYVLSTFVFSPIDWLAAYGRRPLSEAEMLAWFAFWREFGARMGLRAIPATLEDLRAFAEGYERERFATAPSNRVIADATIDLVLGQYGVPRAFRSAGRQAVLALCEPALVRALGHAEPPAALRRLVPGLLALRRHVLRLLPPNRRPNPPRFGRTTYPEGYNIEELGTFARPRGSGPSAAPASQ